MKPIYLVTILALVAGCGGGSGSGHRYYATGPVSKACMSSDRKARNDALCGCVQAAANDELRGGDQRRAVKFYRDPHQAQEVRQSDRRSDKDFWTRYSAFVKRAERMCTGL
ncbi:hypothetical protein CEW88_04370 [Alloyangia pacifica]|uniref:Arginine transporter n=1 Tax=Alloyangia pacifica TaxID=311180 RepID=A0A2U8HB34_9RHOB|nr:MULTISPECIES: hypothetical protein [Roseobacteraceae]AWI82964.1 hypothetical protein CEW88_04370 [Alloyangia pacifica]NDV49128.1 hypothetical protein [Salipiger sp. PrR003]NDW31386.1 hypothetical protein [Salipiger sp. PrR007]